MPGGVGGGWKRGAWVENWVVLGMTRFTVLGREGEEYVRESERQSGDREGKRKRKRKCEQTSD